MSSRILAQPPRPARSFHHQNIDFHVYDTPEAMGRASAIHLAESQLELLEGQESVSFLLMAAPSAFPFYAAYIDLVKATVPLQQALARTHFFHFDEYALPPNHPASFGYLLRKRFFSPLEKWVQPRNLHFLKVDGGTPEESCKEYARAVLDAGPDLQLKGVGENGHWGFHEPGIPLDAEPAYMRVSLSQENAAQQLRDHPDLFQSPDDVPLQAYTANVPLLLRTRHLIEDNVPQATKAFALLAAYANEVIDPIVPTSALKLHPHAIVRTTSDASWALEEYRAHGYVANDSLDQIALTLAGGPASPVEEVRARITRVLDVMKVATGQCS